MADSKTVLTAVNEHIAKHKQDAPAYRDAFELIRNIGSESGSVEVGLAHDLLARIQRANLTATDRSFKIAMYELQRRIRCYGAADCFDDYCLYMEMDRPFDKQFYLPRRFALKHVAQSMDDLAKRKLRLLAVSMPPGTGKTTLALFYLTWLAGRNPEKPNLTGSHNRDFLAGTYGECLRLLDPNGEYLFGDVFPGRHVINTNAKALMIDVGDSKKDMQRFGTLEFTSVGSGNAGKVRAENILYCDDLVDGLETALSKDQLDKLWGMYTTDLRQRKIGDCVELHIATRWSVHDVIGRLEAQYGDSDEAKFIKIPALNENEESNFNYPIDAGFTTKFYLEQREIMDDASWRALFMNEPIEREGQLYPEQELRRYFELPDGEPDAIIAVCDTKDRGKDYCVMPVDFVYGEDHYIDAVVCDNSAPNVVETMLWQTLVSNKVHACRFESNAAGGHIAEKIQNEVRSHGGRTKITTKYTTANKETKILVNAPWIKEHCLFKDKSVLDGQKEYKTFLRFLTGYTMMGKNAHDDVPDAMAMLSEYAQGLSVASAERITNPFSRFRR